MQRPIVTAEVSLGREVGDGQRHRRADTVGLCGAEASVDAPSPSWNATDKRVIAGSQRRMPPTQPRRDPADDHSANAASVEDHHTAEIRRSHTSETGRGSVGDTARVGSVACSAAWHMSLSHTLADVAVDAFWLDG